MEVAVRRWGPVVAGVLPVWLAGWLAGGPVRQFGQAAGLVGVPGTFRAERCLISQYEDGPPPSDCRGVFHPDTGGPADEHARIWAGAPVGEDVRAACEGDECHLVSDAEVARTLTLLALTLVPGVVGVLLIGAGLREWRAGQALMMSAVIGGVLLVTLVALGGVVWFVLAMTGL
ncbi:hypothetical protein P3T27_006569 [Kitasatospora sp. MAA19]|uniref:hypothetical protein n=1 Tax=Kitasatospora sp. MAA19 TaxID=3035090 RepID=UPI0024756B48|nr:hypothetical protein [Kitasatospora sp. MAA19]MDH6709820.1 hypothetical protein [Kitasatospora sp. MAA19]